MIEQSKCIFCVLVSSKARRLVHFALEELQHKCGRVPSL